jgi:hypothetical protein
VGRLLLNVLAMVAEFETDLIRMRTREGMKVAKANGRLRGKQPKLKANQAKHLVELHDDLGTYRSGCFRHGAHLAKLLLAPWGERSPRSALRDHGFPHCVVRGGRSPCRRPRPLQH